MSLVVFYEFVLNEIGRRTKAMKQGVLNELNLQPGDLFYDFKTEQVYVMLDQNSICNFNYYDDVIIVLNIRTYKLSCFDINRKCMALINKGDESQ